MIPRLVVIFIGCLAYSLGAMAASSSTKVFPGAEGFGTDTPAGRGGQVYTVTSLADSGAGTLREALLASGPRTIVFAVSGTIHLEKNIQVKSPFVTLACQSAPSPGIQIEGAMLDILTTDVLIRYCKIRTGDSSHPTSNSDTTDAMTIGNFSNKIDVARVVVDHSELVFGPDIGSIAVFNAKDFTISWSILGAGLYRSNHPKADAPGEKHSMGLFLREGVHLTPHYWPTRGSVHHNILLHSNARMPIIQGQEIDYINNLMYNGGYIFAAVVPRSLNYLGNVHIQGPNTRNTNWCAIVMGGNILIKDPTAVMQAYESDSTVEGNKGCVRGLIQGGTMNSFKNAPLFPISIATVHSSSLVENELIGEAGPTLPLIDPLTQMFYDDVSNRTGTWYNGNNFNGTDGFPSYTTVLPNLKGRLGQADSDKDGMPDSWEQQYFGNLSQGGQVNSSSDFDGDNYTDLEEYLNGTDPIGITCGGEIKTVRTALEASKASKGLKRNLGRNLDSAVDALEKGEICLAQNTLVDFQNKVNTMIARNRLVEGEPDLSEATRAAILCVNATPGC